MSEEPTTVQASIDTTELAPVPQPPGERMFAGRFKSVDALEEGYRNAQQELSRLQQLAGQGQPAPAPAPQQQQQVAPPQQAGQPLLDFQMVEKMRAEVANGGQLSQETLATLQQHQVDPALVMAMLSDHQAGQAAMQDQYRSGVVGAVGGMDQYKAMAEWSVTGLTQAEREIYNAEVNSGSLERAKAAAKSLQARYLQARRAPGGEQIRGEHLAAPRAEPISSMRELIEIQKTERYRSDPTYRAEVLARAAASPNLQG